MAGSFGFEHDHYDISVKIGERELLPAVREASKETLVMADGFSCKTQIEELTDRRALHTAQVLEMALQEGTAGPAGSYPEQGLPDVAGVNGHRRRRIAALAGGGALTAAALAAARMRR